MTDTQDSVGEEPRLDEPASRSGYEEDEFNPFLATLRWGWLILLSIAVLAGLSAYGIPANEESDFGDVAFKEGFGQVALVCGGIGVFVLVVHIAVLALLWKPQKP